MDRPNILVICGKNKRRSRTAEFIFKNDDRFNIRSAGLSPKSDRRLTENDLIWADLILVMETEHRSRLKQTYAATTNALVEVLHVPDEYEFMDEELIEILQTKIDDLFHRYFKS
ncbi:low molecular weight protein tyrosine phosphatase family protein [Mucilaginibacter auburnensis]|uniref:Protein-tyrosine phosphatase n=1 Tax=Mucilaginibacter auburnensis TaxID=1457233 RepID=A0A2H9VN38_9SPHI|nr:protein-tyrosine-phosphatase [Mucilaginibacter auburnensis]PJJ79744.1 protein-tyrosine phosphatase [Mucilaginibacter auburnensis]